MDITNEDTAICNKCRDQVEIGEITMYGICWDCANTPCESEQVESTAHE